MNKNRSASNGEECMRNSSDSTEIAISFCVPVVYLLNKLKLKNARRAIFEGIAQHCEENEPYLKSNSIIVFFMQVLTISLTLFKLNNNFNGLTFIVTFYEVFSFSSSWFTLFSSPNSKSNIFLSLFSLMTNMIHRKDIKNPIVLIVNTSA